MKVIKKLAVIYDGIHNSVFVSQVLTPLRTLLAREPHLEIILVSFEKKRISDEHLTTIIPPTDRLKVLIAPRLPYIGFYSLYPSILYLNHIIKHHAPASIIARGPLAGMVALRASANTMPITIQVRGLCAQELKYARMSPPAQGLAANHSWLASIKHALHNRYYHFLYRSLDELEKRVFSLHNDLVTFEVVSNALKDYMVATYNTSPTHILLAQHDIPLRFDDRRIAQMKKEAREKLGIADDRVVYCYSGSLQPWQCIDQTIEFFVGEYRRNPHAFFLALTTDPITLIDYMTRSGLPQSAYAVRYVAPHEVSFYLAAADAGILFREKNIINWVSRPTKMLEYQSVNLKIIHNNTVGALSEMRSGNDHLYQQ